MGATNPGLNIFANQPPLDLKTTGRVFWVGNSTTVFVPGGVTGVNAAGAYGDSPQRPFATIEYASASGPCVADRGDVIVCLPGHVEDITAAGGLTLTIAGVTVLFLGDGATRATIRFSTAVGSDVNINAANITFGAKGKDLGPRFLANIDALTGPIDVNSARFRMYGAKWYDGTTINTTDCVVGDANADNVEIDDFEFVDGDAGGTAKQSFIQFAGATGVILRNIKCTGTFATGIIENGTAWIDALLENCVLDNAASGPAVVCVLLQATSTGWVKECHFRVSSGTVYVTADNDMQFAESFGYSTDASAGEKVGTILAGDLEAKIDVIDAFHDVPTADVTTNAQMRDVVGNKTDAAAAGAVSTTETIMAYAKQLVSAIIVVDEFHDVPAADATVNAQINEVVGNKTDASVYVPGTQNSLAAYAKGTANLQEQVATTAAAVIAAGTATIFTIAGGPIEVQNIISVCTSNNDATATLLKYTADPTDGTATDLSAASATLASATAGTITNITGTLANPTVIAAQGTAISQAARVVVPVGVIQTITSGGATTGNWTHHLRYKPLARGVTVS